MRNVSHTFNTVHGDVVVELDIYTMDRVESIDIYEQDERLFSAGGFRVEAIINGTPRGTHFIPNNLSAYALEGDARDEARHFLAIANQEGFFGE